MRNELFVNIHLGRRETRCGDGTSNALAGVVQNYHALLGRHSTRCVDGTSNALAGVVQKYMAFTSMATHDFGTVLYHCVLRR